MGSAAAATIYGGVRRTRSTRSSSSSVHASPQASAHRYNSVEGGYPSMARSSRHSPNHLSRLDTGVPGPQQRMVSPLKATLSDLDSEDDSSIETRKTSRRRRHIPGSGYYNSMSRRHRSQDGRSCMSCVPSLGFRRSRRCALLSLGVLLSVAMGLLLFFHKYEIQFQTSIYSSAWVKKEYDNIKPLKGCFNPANISPEYNMAASLAPRRHMINSGLSLRRGLSCYDFAATIRADPNDQKEQLTVHTYWRVDLRPFGERHAAAIDSFLATQDPAHSKMILWSNGADTLARNQYVAPYLEKWPDNFEVRQVNMAELSRGTEIDGLLDTVGFYDKRAWVDGDALRLLVLWHYGGIWMDMDMVLTRDLHTLMESEFLIQWDCYDHPYFAMNGALMHFRKHSPYLCEAFHIMATEPFPEPNTFTWGAHLYSKLHQRLLAAHVQPFAVLPWCFADPRNCRTDIRFPDPFLPDPSAWAGQRWEKKANEVSGREMFEERIGNVWSIHLHNQWEKPFPEGGWVASLLQRYRAVLAARAEGRREADVAGERGTSEL